MRAANLGLKFLLELMALALLGIWGAQVGHGVWSAVLAVVAPGCMVLVWGLFAAPRSSRRLATPLRIPLEIAVFLCAAVAAYAAGARVVAAVFAGLVVLNTVALSVFDQWEA